METKVTAKARSVTASVASPDFRLIPIVRTFDLGATVD
jgi:hypothetical protein